VDKLGMRETAGAKLRELYVTSFASHQHVPVSLSAQRCALGGFVSSITTRAPSRRLQNLLKHTSRAAHPTSALRKCDQTEGMSVDKALGRVCCSAATLLA
jgi:hypothetical protein